MECLLTVLVLVAIIAVLVVNRWRRRGVVGVHDAKTHVEDRRRHNDARYDNNGFDGGGMGL
jgi:FtsZ-interacting cell division protein ZipA